MNLDRLIEFIKLTHAFQQTKRSIFVTGEDRLEHDAEHSYQLAMVGWYLISSCKLSLDISLMIKYALVHDLVEVYAGDTPNFGHGSELRADKAEREEKALHTLKESFPEFPEMIELISEYEKRSTPESEFVYALDKCLSSINIYTDRVRSWFKNNVTLQEMVDSKRPRIEKSKEILSLFDALIDKAKLEEHILFPKK